MRILMIIHTPWSRELGASRVQLELGEEFQRNGHEVEKFSYEDAFPKSQSPLERLTCNFSRQAKAFVQKHGKSYDIIDAHQTDLPFTKRELGFHGLLVARSVGLIPLYEKILKEVDQNRPAQVPNMRRQLGDVKRSLERVIGWRSRRRRTEDVVPSLRTADLINVCNHDELNYVRDTLVLGHKCVCLPFGLSSERTRRFAETLRTPKERLMKRQVVFIGSWSSRKGAWDWGKIIRSVRERVRDASFLFLGTGASERVVRRDVNIEDGVGIEVRPSYRTEELPALLCASTVGAFPSYVEGFPFAVLEKLSGGLPTVAYDAPGAREALRILDSRWLVPSGDTALFAERLIEILTASEGSYAELAQQSYEVSKLFSWETIASNTLSIYNEHLSRLP